MPSQEHLVSFLCPQFASRVSVAHGDGQEPFTVYEGYQLVLVMAPTWPSSSPKSVIRVIVLDIKGAPPRLAKIIIHPGSYSAKKGKGSWESPTPFTAIMSSRARIVAPVMEEF